MRRDGHTPIFFRNLGLFEKVVQGQTYEEVSKSEHIALDEVRHSCYQISRAIMRDWQLRRHPTQEEVDELMRTVDRQRAHKNFWLARIEEIRRQG